MLTFHPLDVDRELDRSNPLFVGNFFDLKGMWWRKRKQRQGLIISVAVAWYRIMKSNPAAAGFVEKETLITNLTNQVKDARVILDKFFNVTKIGFNFNNGNKSPSTITPKRLGKRMLTAIKEILKEIYFCPGAQPVDEALTKSYVHVQKNASHILARLKEENREDLIPPVSWILRQDSPITFYFRASGALQQRDTSVWPVRAIEMWPGWLRKALFGTTVDIENAYSQFLVEHLKLKYENSPLQLKLRYPDVLRSDSDKLNFRLEILQLLKLENSYDNMKYVKRILMSLANGSNASAALMTNGSGMSETVALVNEANPKLLPTELAVLGNRLSSIVKQFRAARRDLCLYLLKEKPTRANQKKIFKMYMAWERTARYKIWNAAGQSGLHLHDGVDGIVTDKSDSELTSHIARQTSLRVSVSTPLAEAA